jgi:hypothetical protein
MFFWSRLDIAAWAAKRGKARTFAGAQMLGFAFEGLGHFSYDAFDQATAQHMMLGSIT